MTYQTQLTLAAMHLRAGQPASAKRLLTSALKTVPVGSKQWAHLMRAIKACAKAMRDRRG